MLHTQELKDTLIFTKKNSIFRIEEITLLLNAV